MPKGVILLLFVGMVLTVLGPLFSKRRTNVILTICGVGLIGIGTWQESRQRGAEAALAEEARVANRRQVACAFVREVAQNYETVKLAGGSTFTQPPSDPKKFELWLLMLRSDRFLRTVFQAKGGELTALEPSVAVKVLRLYTSIDVAEQLKTDVLPMIEKYRGASEVDGRVKLLHEQYDRVRDQSEATLRELSSSCEQR